MGDVLRHRSIKLPYPHPTFGELVGIWKSQDKEEVKALGPRGAIGGFLEWETWKMDNHGF